MVALRFFYVTPSWLVVIIAETVATHAFVLFGHRHSPLRRVLPRDEHRAGCSAEYVFEHACFSVALAGFCSKVASSSRDSFWRMNSDSACLLLLSFPCWHMCWCSFAHAVLPHRHRHIGRGNNRLVLCLLGVGQHMTACTELLLLKFRIPPRRSLASCLCLIILSSCAPVYVLQFYTP